MTARDPSFPSLNVWECLNCGEHVPLDEDICPNCGADQDGNALEEDEEDTDAE